MMPVMMKGDPAAEISTVTEGPVRIRVRRVCVSVFVIDPGFDWVPARDSRRFLVWRSPRDPDRVLRHAFANFARFHQLLIAWRQGLENLRMFGDSGFSCRTARQNQRAGGKGQSQRPQKNLTLHVEKHTALPG